MMVVRKRLACLNKETTIQWLAQAQRLPEGQSGYPTGDLAHVIRECMVPDDFIALPEDV